MRALPPVVEVTPFPLACLKRLEVTLQASFAALAALEEVTAFPPQPSLIPPSYSELKQDLTSQ